VQCSTDNESKALLTENEKKESVNPSKLNVEADKEITAKDLLGFAWQIARGMVG